jgi:hypothetical protein
LVGLIATNAPPSEGGLEAIDCASEIWPTRCRLASSDSRRLWPATGLVVDTVPVGWPAALTCTFCSPSVPRSQLSYWASSPDWPMMALGETPV